MKVAQAALSAVTLKYALWQIRERCAALSVPPGGRGA